MKKPYIAQYLIIAFFLLAGAGAILKGRYHDGTGKIFVEKWNRRIQIDKQSDPVEFRNTIKAYYATGAIAIGVGIFIGIYMSVTTKREENSREHAL